MKFNRLYTRDLIAMAEASRRGGTMFKCIKIGERFSFDPNWQSKPERVLIKTSNRTYRHAMGGRRWYSGALTTVYLA